jgi:hypothetical protein
MVQDVGSILAVDFGSVTTRAVLIDVVDGAYRLIARAEERTTDNFPASDLDVGLDRVLRQLTEVTGRRFRDEAGAMISPERRDRSGVDLFAITASLGRPLQAVIVGLVPDVSIASALRAIEGTYIEVNATLTLDDKRDQEEQLNAILLSYPDVIFLVGGTERGAERSVMRLAEVIRLSVSLASKARRPIVIYAGNSALREPMEALFGNLTTFIVAENIRPSLHEERLDSARLKLGDAFNQYKESRDQTFAMLGKMSQTGVLPTAQGYTILADYLGKTQTGGIALIDMGSANSTFAFSSGKGHLLSSIRPDLGLGHSAPQLLASVGLDAVREWLPFNISSTELTNYAYNKSLRPMTIPMSLRDLYIEHALLRAGIRAMITRANPEWENSPMTVSRIILAGAALTKTGHPAYDVLLAMDTLQPVGIVSLSQDPFALVPAMGAIAPYAPDAVVQLLDETNLVRLGTALVPTGNLRKERTAVDVIIHENGEKLRYAVDGGHVFVYPIPIGQSVEVRIRCARGVTINGKRRFKMTIEGGAMGLMIDARSRPLNLGDVTMRSVMMPKWVQEATGDLLQDIDPKWLEAVEDVQEVAEKARDKRRSEIRKNQKPAKADKKGKSDKSKKSNAKNAKQDDLSELLSDDALESLLDDEEDEQDELGALRNALS